MGHYRHSFRVAAKNRRHPAQSPTTIITITSTFRRSEGCAMPFAANRPPGCGNRCLSEATDFRRHRTRLVGPARFRRQGFGDGFYTSTTLGPTAAVTAKMRRFGAGYWLIDGAANVYFAGNSGYAGCFAAMGAASGRRTWRFSRSAPTSRIRRGTSHMNTANAVAASAISAPAACLAATTAQIALRRAKPSTTRSIALENARAAADRPQLCRATGFGETVVIRAA